MQGIYERITQLGITLPSPPAAVGNYLGTRKSGNLLFVSGRKSDLCGAVGAEVTEQQAKVAARDTVLLLLAIIQQDLGSLQTISGIVKLNGFIRSAAAFDRQPAVLDGASDILIDIFGEAGRHARTATGVHQLPFGATIQLEMIVEVNG